MKTSTKWIVSGVLAGLLALVVAFFVYRWVWHHLVPPEASVEVPPKAVPARTNANQAALDLTPYINGQLDRQWNATTYPGDDLAELAPGVHEFDGVLFDIRGVIQLSSRVWAERRCPFPEKVEGIPIQRACRYLYLLHGDGGANAPTGTTVALLVLRYNDGTLAELPIQHNIHVKDWWSYGRPPPSDPNTVVAWTGLNKATARMGNSIRLYKTRFENPHPEKPVASLDYVSTMEDPGAFLVGLTVE